MHLKFATEDAKAVVCDGNCGFPTQSLSKPEVSEINKHIRNMTKINAAYNTAKPFIRTWKL